MPFEIPLGEISPGLATGVQSLMAASNQRQNDAMQMQLAELNLKSMMMQQNAKEASQNYALAQERLAQDVAYRNSRLQDADLNREATNSRYFSGLEEREAARAQQMDQFKQRLNLSGERLQDLEEQRGVTNAFKERQLNLSEQNATSRNQNAGADRLSKSYNMLKGLNAEDMKALKNYTQDLEFQPPEVQSRYRKMAIPIQQRISQRQAQMTDLSNQILRGGQASVSEDEEPSQVDENDPLGIF